ncbi:DNA alkylation repair protein [Candidatus Woesearchaeota archaeon]|nr:DNA alkylation repair protein [Candidatus Woesearchaeota archaeon]
MLTKLKKDLVKASSKEKAIVLQRFFKTGPGQYGEGDVFLGVVVPDQRKIAQQYVSLSFNNIQELLNSKFHEHRLTGLLILTYQYEKATEKEQKQIYEFYLKNTKAINNWDLVDVTTPKIVGAYLIDKDKSILYKLVKSKDLWERRISILATHWFIRNNQFNDTIKISELLLTDSHDLIQKAVGWMLREVGKRDENTLIKFLNTHYKIMPRTMLRYSIERLNKKQKAFFMKK